MSGPKVGVVCTSSRDAERGRRGVHADSYLIAERGRASWLEDGTEDMARVDGDGVLLAVADGEGEDVEAARTASSSFCRALAKRYRGKAPAAPTASMVDFLVDAHTRMYWKTRERKVRLGASGAVAWLLGRRLHWVEIGTCRVFLWRDGVLRRVARPWPAGEHQRFLLGSRGLGDDTTLHLMPGTSCGAMPLHDGDQVLLCTDGFWDVVDTASTGQLLQHVDDPQTAAVSLMERAVARGAQGSVTCVLAAVGTLPAVDTTTISDAPPPRRTLRELSTEP